MRWIKHLSLAHADVEISAMLEEFGAEAYGVYWLMVEHISAPMEPGKLVPAATHSVVKWSQICHCSARVWRSIAMSLAEKKLIALQTNRDRIEIEIPNILKYKDEYSKKSGQTPDLIRADTDTEGEQSKTKATGAVAPPDKPAPPPPKVVALKPIDEVAIWFEAEFWPLYPRKVAKPAALKAIRRHASTPEARAQILTGLRAHAPALRVKDPEFVPFPSTWINQQRWLDPPESMRNKSALLPFQPREGIAEQMTRVVRERIERGERPI